MEKITTAASVSAAWRGMSDEEQYTALQKMAWTVRRSGSKRGAEWIQTQDDAMTVAAEAWLRMGAALERNERADEPRPLIRNCSHLHILSQVGTRFVLIQILIPP